MSHLTNLLLLLQLIISQYVKELSIQIFELVVDKMELNHSKLPNQVIYFIKNFCGGYRSRTDDPLRARQVL